MATVNIFIVLPGLLMLDLKHRLFIKGESEANRDMPKTCILSNDQQGCPSAGCNLSQVFFRSLWENVPTFHWIYMNKNI